MVEQAAPTCSRHPKVETYLKCASCNTPICPDCFVQTPVGYKCRDCGTHRQETLYKLSLVQSLVAAAIGIVGGGLAGWMGGWLGFYGIWLALPYGRLLGGLMLRASGRKLGLPMEILTGASIILGAVGVRLLLAYLMQPVIPGGPAPNLLAPLVRLFVPYPFHAITIIAVAAAAVSRIRHIWSFWKF